MKGRVLCLIAAIGVALGGLTACKEETNAKLIVQYATMKVIEKGKDAAEQQERAEKIRDIASKAAGMLKGDTVTINLLEAAVREQIGKLNLSPADGFLANALVQEVISELESRIGTAVLNEEQRFKVATVLGWVVSGTAFAGS